jgi:hypothetical protein
MNICPKPVRWSAIYDRLLRACQEHAIASRPPVPLILAGWSCSDDFDKAQRWTATKAWAEQNGLVEFLTVTPDEWYSVEKPSPYPRGPRRASWRFEPVPTPSRDDIEAAFIRLSEDWAKIAGDLCRCTRPSRITGKKRRRLLVMRSPSAPRPPWGEWDKLDEGDARRGFTEFRRRVNAAAAPLEIDHLDFEIERIP